MSDDQHRIPEPILTATGPRGVVTVTLNRPEVNNAYNAEMLHGLHAAMDELEQAKDARVLVVRGAGRHFQAGADLGWLAGLRGRSPEDHLAASRLTGSAVDRLNRLRLPVVAVVQGACFGGGTGLVAAADVVVAADSAVFSIAEVRWGLHASIIIPQLSDAISARQVRRYALTAERFDAVEAQRIGLVHEVAREEELEDAVDGIVDALLGNGPRAMEETKGCLLQHSWGGFDPTTFDDLARRHAQARQSDEGSEGLQSFLEGRPAAWAPEDD